MSLYEILYTIEQTRFILPSEYEELTNVTSIYLDDYFTDLFADDPLVNYKRSSTELVDFDFSFGDPVEVIYNTTVEFTANTPTVPNLVDLDAELLLAFTGDNELVYRTFVVDNLDSSNLFDTTSLTQFRFIVSAA